MPISQPLVQDGGICAKLCDHSKIPTEIIMKRLSLSLALSLFAVPAFGQAAAPVTGVGTAKQVWEMSANYVIKSAEMLPEADYSFKPVASVRSFGQLFGHFVLQKFVFRA